MHFAHITFDPKVMGGRACIRGMRIPVSVIVSQIAHGATVEDVLQGYPDLERDDVVQALEYAAWLTREEIRACQGPAVRFLADMGVDIRVVDWLRSQGHDTHHLREHGMHRASDEAFFAKAIVEDRIVVTFDLDFGTLAALARDRAPGIVLFRLSKREVGNGHRTAGQRTPLRPEKLWRAPRSSSSKTLASGSEICRSAGRSPEGPWTYGITGCPSP